MSLMPVHSARARLKVASAPCVDAFHVVEALTHISMRRVYEPALAAVRLGWTWARLAVTHRPHHYAET